MQQRCLGLLAALVLLAQQPSGQGSSAGLVGRYFKDAEITLKVSGRQYYVNWAEAQLDEFGVILGLDQSNSKVLGLRVGTLSMPNLLGKAAGSQEFLRIKSRLERGGVRFLVVDSAVETENAWGRCIRQAPDSGITIRPDDVVAVVRARPAAVPSLFGMTADDAQKTLRQAGFVPVLRDSFVEDEDNSGLVLRSDPAADSRTRPGASVTIWVARYEEQRFPWLLVAGLSLLAAATLYVGIRWLRRMRAGHTRRGYADAGVVAAASGRSHITVAPPTSPEVPAGDSVRAADEDELRRLGDEADRLRADLERREEAAALELEATRQQLAAITEKLSQQERATADAVRMLDDMRKPTAGGAGESASTDGLLGAYNAALVSNGQARDFLHRFRPRRVEARIEGGTVLLSEATAGLFWLVQDRSHWLVVPHHEADHFHHAVIATCFETQDQAATDERPFFIQELRRPALCVAVERGWRLESKGAVDVAART